MYQNTQKYSASKDEVKSVCCNSKKYNLKSI